MRFKEIVSIQKIVDTYTGKEYDGLVDEELLEIINNIVEENYMLKHGVQEINTIIVDLLEKQFKIKNGDI